MKAIFQLACSAGRIALVAGAFFVLLPTAAHGQETEGTYAEFLRKTPLTMEECMQSEPAELMALIREKHHFSSNETRKEEVELDALFFRKYLEIMRPAVDAKYPEAEKMREPLRKLLYTICDTMNAAGRRPDPALTHGRVDAYAEYLLANIYSWESAGDDDVSWPVWGGDPTPTKAAAFLRLKLAMAVRGGREVPDYDRYAAKIAAELAAVERATTKGRAEGIRATVVQFADDFREKLEP